MPTPTSFALDDSTQSRLDQLAAARQQTPHSILREAVQQYLEREDKREQLRADARKAWEHYQATGLHAEAEETDAWLASLEAGEDAPAPVCHV